jgi:FHS family L-fucose permease-like MFS transporter
LHSSGTNQYANKCAVAFAWSYPLYLNFTHKAKELDAYTESHVGIQEGAIDNDSIIATKDVEAMRTEKY